MNIHFKTCRGRRAYKYLNDIARLRMKVFAEWPYIYKGSLAYERKYLEKYFSARHSFVGLAFDGDKVIGATTAVWLPEADEDFKRPFKEQNFRMNQICYFGESVLLPKYRGLKIGKKFMKMRQGFANGIKGVRMVAFCAVRRPMNHPLKPKGYRPLDEFWQKQGFVKRPEMTAKFKWQDRNLTKETTKTLVFWIKKL